MRFTSGAAITALVLTPLSSFADEGRRRDTTAEMTRPATVGELADRKYIFTWMDGDQLIASESAYIDFYYTPHNPPAYQPGTVPAMLEGKSIAHHVPVHDTENAFTWDTTDVPAGSYWIWSLVTDPDIAFGAKQMISFSPGVVTIAHPGDRLRAAAVLSEPDNPFRWPNAASLDIGYECFDPYQTAQVRIEGTQAADGMSGMVVFAEALPSAPNGHFEWDTSNIPEGEWKLRVTITDTRGSSFTAYDRYSRFVNHPEGQVAAEMGCTSVRAAGGPPSIADLAMIFVGLFFLNWGRATCRARRRAGRTGRR